MSDIKLFQITGPSVVELSGVSVAVEKSLQNLIESHLKDFLSVRFLKSEYHTGKAHGGRIDTLGIDENGCPVIIEYKRALNENVINQGLFYLDWLLDHKGEFTLLVLNQLGQAAADNIEWSNPRLICIAGDFTKYDQHAVQQIPRYIDLIRYKRYGDCLVLFELVNASAAEPIKEDLDGPVKTGKYKTFLDSLEQCPTNLRDRFESFKAFVMALGDDVQMKQLKYYVAFRRLQNFACVELHATAGELVVYLKVDPKMVQVDQIFTRDVTNIGHNGTGDLEIRIKSGDDLEQAKPLIVRSYEGS